MNAGGRLQLPSHEHSLVLRDMSGNCRFSCIMCPLLVKGGPAYQCPDCRNVFIIHKSCAEPAPQIQHPLHPEHPLVLSELGPEQKYCFVCGRLLGEADCRCEEPVPEHFYVGSGKRCYGCHEFLFDAAYRCEVCDVCWHVGCAAANLPPLEDEHKKEEVIQHFAHEHPLTSFYVNECNDKKCKACKEHISGLVYGCRGCMFILHESCALLPRELLEHPFHPRHPLALRANFDDDFDCKACYEYNPFAYRCDECDFNLGLHCVASVLHPSLDNQNSEELGRQARQHFSHPHQLIFLHATAELFIECELCREKISGNFCCCPDCLFMLHESCAELSQEIVHPLHPEHPLIYQSKPDDETPSCYLCHDATPRMSVVPTFDCKECSFFAHVACAVQTLSALRAGVAPTIQNFQVHPHPMGLSRNCDPEYSFCMICEGGIDEDVGYWCQICAYRALHIKCAEATIGLEHPFHPQHPLILCVKPPRESAPCDACLRPFHSELRFAYRCDDCDFQMHVICALQKLTLKHQRHEHDLTYFEETGHLQCNLCYENCSIDLYRCVPCNYNLHYSCMYLPPSVKHKLHIHPMVLRDRVVVDHLRLDDQYCDLCETIRHPDHGVYYCDQCYCAAHIDCAIPKLEVEQWKVGEYIMLRKLDEEIAGEYAKREELKANMEKLKKKLEASTNKLEASTNKLESLENKRREIMSAWLQEGAELENE